MRGMMDVSSVKRHEALVGLQRLSLVHRTLLPTLITRGLLPKLILFLREQQFQQLCFEALRLIHTAVDEKRAAEHFLHGGAVTSLLNLVRRDTHPAILGMALWTLTKLTNRVAQPPVLPPCSLNEFIDIG